MLSPSSEPTSTKASSSPLAQPCSLAQFISKCLRAPPMYVATFIPNSAYSNQTGHYRSLQMGPLNTLFSVHRKMFFSVAQTSSLATTFAIREHRFGVHIYDPASGSSYNFGQAHPTFGTPASSAVKWGVMTFSSRECREMYPRSYGPRGCTASALTPAPTSYLFSFAS